MTEPGELNKPLLQAAGDAPPAPPTPPQPPQPEIAEPPTQPSAAPRPQLFGTGAPGASGAPPYASYPTSPPPPVTPLPPEPPVPSQPRWRRGLAIVAVVAMVLVGGALLGNASRGGSLFSNDSSPAAQNTPASGSSNTSSVNPSQGSTSASGVTGKVQPGLVNITTTLYGGQGEGAGTGMVISSSGEVLTNNHVIENAESIKVEIGGDGSAHPASVIGYDVADDVALVKIQNVSGLDTIPIGNPDNISVNDAIVVLGNALGRGGDPSAASGTVTALNRQITATDADGTNAETLNNLIQVQADVQPGDSGGALIDSAGQVVGMTTAASSNGFRFQQETDGVGFAIRIDKALSVIKQIRNGEEVDGVHVGSRGLLGVSLESPTVVPGRGGNSSSSSGDGAQVIDVQDGPAKDAGIQTGDVIVSLGDATITSSSDLSTAIDKYHAGDKVEVGWTDSSGETQHASVKLIEGPPA
jgi:S1-C subfamily serine protease